MVLTLAGALLALMGLASALMLLLGQGGWLLWLLFPLWYVLVLAGAAGGLGTAALTRKPDDAGDPPPGAARRG